MLQKTNNSNPGDTNDPIVLILHDAIEDHPECWFDILSGFWIDIFRDILILSKIDIPIRREILSWFIESTPAEKFDYPIIGDIFQILSPVDPIIKLKNFSKYSHTDNRVGHDAQLIENALRLYDKAIIKTSKNPTKARDEYLSLGNYLYFWKKDSQRKLQDMLHNMSDMHQMGLEYIKKRRIKAYMLWVKCKVFWLQDEYAELQWAFQLAGYAMYTDAEVLTEITST